ncbi:unnamed protein product, partial [Ectocarpus sp. 12 AP-2014]
ASARSIHRRLSACFPAHRFPPFYDENPIGIYQKILAGKLDIPRHVDSKAKDIIKRLLTIDRTSRLGCMKGGSRAVKEHKWFHGMDWEAV